MDTLTAITTRASAIRLAEPAPTPEQLDIILDAGARAPDHGRLAPWRFVVVEGEARQTLGQVLAGMRRRQFPETPEEELQKEILKVMRAPTIVAVAARPTANHKVPEIEQIVAVGAAVQNMILAAHAMGLGTMWKTGGNVYKDEMKTALGLNAADQIIAMLYLGTPVSMPPARDVKLDGLVSRL